MVQGRLTILYQLQRVYAPHGEARHGTYQFCTKYEVERRYGEKKRKVEQDRRTCIWPDVEVLESFPTIHHFTLDYPTAIVVGQPIHRH